MSAFKYPNFIKEFAYRTMANYYLLRDCDDETKLKITAKSRELKETIREMKMEDFESSLRYEVTSLINSLVGLLIFPQQMYYEKMSKHCNWDTLVELKRCVDSSYDTPKMRYVNSYEEECAPFNILRHMRNAIAHDRIQLYPLAYHNDQLTHIIFKDKEKVEIEISSGRKITKEYRFNLTIPVDKLEKVIMEICQYLLSFEVW